HVDVAPRAAEEARRLASGESDRDVERRRAVELEGGAQARPGRGPLDLLREGRGRDVDAPAVERHRSCDRPEVAGLASGVRGRERQTDVGVDEPGARQAALEVEERHGIGKAEEGTGVAERRGSGPRRLDGESAGALAGEEEEPAVAREEQEPCAAVGACGGEPGERCAGELNAAWHRGPSGLAGRCARNVAVARRERRQYVATRLDEVRAPRARPAERDAELELPGV